MKGVKIRFPELHALVEKLSANPNPNQRIPDTGVLDELIQHLRACEFCEECVDKAKALHKALGSCCDDKCKSKGPCHNKGRLRIK